MVERRIKEARFPAVEASASFDLAGIPSLNKTLDAWNSPVPSTRPAAKTMLAKSATAEPGQDAHHLGIGPRGLRERAIESGSAAAALVRRELLEARDEKRLLRLQRQVTGCKLLIIDELGYVLLSQRTGADLLFEISSQRYEARFQPSSHRTCHSTNGPACSGPSV